MQIVLSTISHSCTLPWSNSSQQECSAAPLLLDPYGVPMPVQPRSTCCPTMTAQNSTATWQPWSERCA
jgi:hypothetical protein